MLPTKSEVSFKELEKDILEFWEDNKIFAQQNKKRASAPEFLFYDGPPFGNGLPHYGHLLANTVKDVVPRYWIMRGHKVRRRFGWDCHGLPVEYEVEKKESLKGRPDILKFGVSKFNEVCRESVLFSASQWQKTITRLGRWVDWNDQYRTMDLSFMETVWWVFAELYKKNLIYKDYKVVPYSPRTTSVVSNFEANQNYQNVQDPSIWVKFKLKDSDEFLIVWTTTPWTLPANLALAVGKDIEYVRVEDQSSKEIYIVAKQRLEAFYENISSEYKIISNLTGKDLLGRKYLPLFSYFKEHKNAFQIVAADYVTTEEGSGIVHQAPAYGEDDFYVCKNHEIELVDPIDDDGLFTASVPDLQGLYFKDADKIVCKNLKEQGLLLKHETLVHKYPFDERTNTPLMYKAVPAWFVAVEKIADKLVANNQKINWVPSHLKDGRMGTWLANARDWAISRNRFWGTPLPVWVCEKDSSHIKVISSVSELEKLSGKKVTDIHKHKLGEVNFTCPTCKGTMKIVDLVFDCWFESGSMPYAQFHYPFENKSSVESTFPADFIAEGLDQTRGWFYTLNVLATALFDKPAFKNVVVNGIILDETGKKMSKRHRNYTPPDDLIDKYGADSVRLYMLNSSLLKAEDLVFSDKGVQDITRQVLLPLWNAFSFLSTYAHADNWKPRTELLETSPSNLDDDLDRWIVSKLQSLVAQVNEHMQEYQLYLVVPQVVNFVDDLTNWYIRLNRRRFWGGDNSQAYDCLFYVLFTFVKVLAPFAPFISEKIYSLMLADLSKAEDSVHLCDFPQVKKELICKDSEHRMEMVQLAITQGRSLRQKHKIKTRQVLGSLTVIVPSQNDQEILSKAENLLQRELNIKEIIFTSDEGKHVRLKLKPNFITLGKRLGKKLSLLQKELQKINSAQDKVLEFMNKFSSDNQEVNLGEFSLRQKDIIFERGPIDERLISSDKGVTVLLDNKITSELQQEGWAREIVNRIQNLRKDSGLEVSDRIDLEVIAPRKLADSVKKYQNYVMEETLSLDLEIKDEGKDSNLKFAESYKIDGMSCVISIQTTKA
jgi:isoleucyl-tRNA synthetase